MKERIKVLFALPSFAAGGTEHQLLKQLRVYDFERFDVVLLTLFEFPGRDYLYEEIPKDIRVIRCRFSSYWNLAAWKRLLSTLYSFRPRVVVSSAFSANSIFRILKVFFGYRVISREHNTYVEKSVFQRCIDHILSYISFTIVAISKTVAEFASAQAHIPIKKFTVILNGVETEEALEYRQTKKHLAQHIRDELQIPSDKKIILNVGRLKPQKDQKTLIDAFVLFHTNNPEYVLCIVGDGSERINLEKQIREENAESYIRLVGHRRDVYAFYIAADFFVFTSIHEGGPNAVLEALSFGVPTLSTNIAGVDEYMKDGVSGYILSHVPSEIAERLQYAVTLPPQKTQELISEGLKVVQGFSITNVTEQYMNLIEKAALS